MFCPTATPPPTIYAHPPATCTKDYYVSIDSRDRNRVVWPSASQYEVKLDAPPNYTGAQVPRSFKNVVSVELMNAIFPNTNNVLSEMFLFLNIPELDGVLETTDRGRRYFAKLIPGTVIGYYIHSYQDALERPRKTFPFRGARLDKLTIEFRNGRGDLFSFGNDKPHNQAHDPLLQTSLTLKITVEESNRD